MWHLFDRYKGVVWPKARQLNLIAKILNNLCQGTGIKLHTPTAPSPADPVTIGIDTEWLDDYIGDTSSGGGGDGGGDDSEEEGESEDHENAWSQDEAEGSETNGGGSSGGGSSGGGSSGGGCNEWSGSGGGDNLGTPMSGWGEDNCAELNDW